MRDATESLGRASAWVRERLVRAAAAAHDPQNAQAPRERVHVGLEDVGGEGAVRVAGHLLALLGHPAGAVDRARGAPGDHIEHAVYPNHLLDARRQNRDDHSVGDPTPQALEHLLGRKLLTFEVLLQQRVVALGDGLEQLDLCFLDLVFHPGGNLRGLLPVHEGDAAQEPVHALETPLPANGQVQRHDRGAEARPELLDYRNEVRALPVEVVHDDDVDLAALPLEVCHAHPERHAALDLLLAVIEHVPRRPLSPGGNPEHRLPKRGLPTSSVPDQAHVPNHFWFYRHAFLLSAFDLRPYRTGYLA